MARGVPQDLIGREIAHYRVLEKLGSGATGAVYKAEDVRLRRTVALKLFSPRLTADKKARKRFAREAQAASSLDHPAICTVYDVGEVEDTTFLVMAWYDGESLRERLERGPLDVDEALDLAAQIARGLERAHDGGVIHRDVKPGNVRVTDRGEAKIVGFGMAKLASPETTATRSDALPGTPGYISPEQILDEETDHRVDVWSLGVTLYEMLAGRLPFTGGELSGLIDAVVSDDPVPLTELRPDVTRELWAVVAKMLAKRPHDRYSSCGDVAADLDRVARGEPVTGGALPTGRSAELWWKLGPLAVAGAVLAAAVLYLSPMREPSETAPATGDARRLVVLPFTVQGDPELAYLENGMVELLAAKLDGAGSIRAVDPHAVLGYLGQLSEDDRDPWRVAAYFRAGGYVVGSVLRLGNDLRLEASFYGPGGDLLTRTESVATGEDGLLEAIDDLAQGLISTRLGGPGQRLARLAALTTESLPALRSYLAGEQAMRDGQFTEAQTRLQEAVAADPGFALAWYRLWAAAGWGPRVDLAQRAGERTIALADQLGPRERDLVAAVQKESQGAADEAERIYRKLLGFHPDDVDVLRGLGELLYHFNPVRGRPAAEAAPYFERAMAYDPENLESLFHMICIRLSQGSGQEARRLLAYVAESGRRIEQPWSTFFPALHDLAFGEADQRAAKLKELSTAGSMPLFILMNRLQIDLADYATARLLAESLAARRDDDGSWGLYYLGFLELAAGRLQASDEALRAAAERFPGTSLTLRAEAATLPFLPAVPERLEKLRAELRAWDTSGAPIVAYTVTLDAAGCETTRSYLLGLLALRLGDNEGLARALNHLAASRSEDPMAFALAGTLRAVRAWRDGEPEQALRELEQARLEAPRFMPSSFSVYTQGLNRYLRAEILRALGRPEEALPWYRSLVDGLLVPGMPYFGVAWLGQAEVHDELGHRDRALQAYDRFLELWKDADPVLQPLLEQARRRRAELLREDPEAP